MGKYDSNEVIVSGYGLPFLTDTDAAEGYLTDESVVPEDVETSIRRIAVLNDRVVKWIAANRRIPASNPNAPPEERVVAHWLRVCQFYADIAVDPAGQHLDEMASNVDHHLLCQHVIRHGRTPGGDDETIL